MSSQRIIECLKQKDFETALQLSREVGNPGREPRYRILRCAVEVGAKDVLQHFLDNRGFDLADSSAEDRRLATELFDLAKAKDAAIWAVLYSANKKGSYGQLAKEDFIRIVSSGEVSESVREFSNMFSFDLVGENILMEKKTVTSDMSLKTLFNFESCQQILVIEKGNAMTMTVTDFENIGNRAFIDERHKIFLRLGGKEGLPYNPKKRAFLPPSPPLSS